LKSSSYSLSLLWTREEELTSVKNRYRKIALTGLVVSALSACGGAETSGAPPVVVRPPVVPPPTTGPASTEIADLIAFADAGTRTRMQFRDNAANGWERSRQCGGDACVVVDRVPGAEGAGLVIYQRGRDAFIYDVLGSELATMEVPTGIYNGLLTANYRVGADGDWVATVGEMNIWLDMVEGNAGIGGILPYTSPSGGRSSIQFFGDAPLENGTFTDSTLKILVDSGNPTGFETVGTASGLLVSGTDGAAILGTVEATGDPALLLLNGGYAAMHDPRF
jgi:hypothetical protein